MNENEPEKIKQKDKTEKPKITRLNLVLTLLLVVSISINIYQISLDKNIEQTSTFEQSDETTEERVEQSIKNEAENNKELIQEKTPDDQGGTEQNIEIIELNKIVNIQDSSWNEGTLLIDNEILIKTASVQDKDITLDILITNNSSDKNGSGQDKLDYYHEDIEVAIDNKIVSAVSYVDGQVWDSIVLLPGGELAVSLKIPTTKAREVPSITLTWAPSGNLYGRDTVELSLE